MPKPECGRDCPRRHPGCQNPKTCETWRRFEAQKKAEEADRLRRQHAKEDYDAVRYKTRRGKGRE